VIQTLVSFARRVDAWIDVALHWDQRAVHSIAEHPALRRFARMFVTATYLGDGYLWGGLGLGLILFGRSIDRIYVLIGLAITIVNVAVFRLVKVLIGRLRPMNVLPRLRSRIVDGYSFPSGHATTSFGLAWVVARSYPYLAVQVSIYVVAATIALSRVYVREHYPLDVLGGAIIGSLVAVFLYPVFNWLFF
jgi:undecaprenyl-diphosphatase